MRTLSFVKGFIEDNGPFWNYKTEHSETHTTNSVYGEYYAAKQKTSIRVGANLLKLFQYIDSHRPIFQEDLDTLLKFKSCSGKLKYRQDVKNLIKFTQDWLTKLNMKYECFNIGKYVLDGKKVSIPSVILASYGIDPKKKTICAYLHLDVPEPDPTKWSVDPWSLTEVNNVYFGNGTSCGKGPLITWFHVIQAFQGSNIPLPVNIKLIIEFMFHENSMGLQEFLPTRLQDFFAVISTIIVCQGEWIGKKKPCLIYGTVGAVHMELSIAKSDNSKTDIHEDMERICGTIVDNKENILIKNYYDYVEQISPDEETVYEKITEFDPEDYRDQLPEFKRSWDKVKLLMSIWRLPSVSFSETLECICDKKEFTKIKKIISFKIVPNQVVDRSEKLVRTHIKNVVKELQIENTVECKMMNFKRPWFENSRLPCYNAAKKAIIQVYKEDPNMIRESTPREVVTILDRILEKNIVMLPLSCSGSNSGEANENISVRNFFEGHKVIAAFLLQIASEK